MVCIFRTHVATVISAAMVENALIGVIRMSPTLHAPVYTLHIQLEDIEPPIWRRIEVPASFTLRRLHDVIQLVMGWQDSHMHLFEIDGGRYGFGDNEWDDEDRDDSEVLLADVVQQVGQFFVYSYDFGDDWTHRVKVEEIRREVARRDVPRLLAGARACPPEDCGGVSGYHDLVEAVADPDHEEHEALLEWLGGGYDPAEYDVARHDRRLDRLRRARTPAGGRRPATTRPPAGRSARGAGSPVALRVTELTAILNQFRQDVPALPVSIADTAEDLLRRFAGSDPETFMGVRRLELWAAAAVHASYMLHPYWMHYPLKPMTLADLSEMWSVSSASISKRSGQLREGVRLRPLLR
ncbi:MAG: hypothetical protein WEF86_02080 [Gemmatimonadota bacterium]